MNEDTSAITDIDHRQALREVRSEQAGQFQATPADTALVGASLRDPGLLVEVDVVADVPLG